ncbi:MAG: type II toxin-antitoxin system RelE/ParE family toxin [Chitinophagaceae bacterium]|jgi:mRNA interferase RelE/StbE|nr:type II toxin-antitoxin system RelE/ParE family toxin [Chitinophagaceae bacterium]
MEVMFAKSYMKDLRGLPKYVIAAADDVADKLYAAKSLQESGVDYEKMKGEKNYYRIRIGDYRIIAKYIHPSVIMLMLGSRGDVYKK